jgi:hypothetical protein
LTVVASQELGELGLRDSDSVTVDWKWYYHVPALGLWALLVVLLVAVPSNHHVQAWLILLPVAAVGIGVSLVCRLLAVPPDSAEFAGGALVAVAASWAVLWLVSPWLARRSVWTALVVSPLLMFAASLLYYAAFFGGASAGDYWPWGIFHTVASVSLVIAHVLAAIACRRGFTPRRFLAMLLLAMLVFTLLAVPATAVAVILAQGVSPVELALQIVMMMVTGLVAGGVLGVVLYVVNLPFLTLAWRNPFYAARFQQVFRLAPAATGSPFGAAIVEASLVPDGVTATTWRDA